ncbi:hypothetical protein CWI84_01345 [Idiomarina tyrosinivorans]|uniref:YbhG-like alpha-helical hairpin domain-containing protein n=1 Tax=Idiomarina tyrosinivorans TaxID=1445662 RepID=A0A432ZUB8_9GAMM|nr:HlyD family efflux transporter periplasmic adaptor subunit [Idiomarina tyrosinivorans]RUO81432.1 hypothetical protein CWI84_01345 [Idiomarina tyrosinivorans]
MFSHRLFIVALSLIVSGCQFGEDSQAFGTVERERFTLSATADQVITEVYAEQGQTLQQGDPILQLDPQLQQPRVAQAQAQFQQAQARLSELQNGNRQQQIASAKAEQQQAQIELAEAQRQLRRQQALVQQQLVSEQQLEQYQLAVDVAEQRLARATQQYQLLREGSRTEVLRQAEAAVANAQAAVTEQQRLLDQLTVRAPRAALVDDILYYRGERVHSGTPVVSLLAPDSAYVRVYLPQAWLSDYQVGDQVQLTVDGRQQPLTGTIRWISAEASFTPNFALHQQERARLMYLAEITLSGDVTLPSGTPVQLHHNG